MESLLIEYLEYWIEGSDGYFEVMWRLCESKTVRNRLNYILSWTIMPQILKDDFWKRTTNFVSPRLRWFSHPLWEPSVSLQVRTRSECPPPCHKPPPPPHTHTIVHARTQKKNTCTHPPHTHCSPVLADRLYCTMNGSGTENHHGMVPQLHR